MSINASYVSAFYKILMQSNRPGYKYTVSIKFTLDVAR